MLQRGAAILIATVMFYLAAIHSVASANPETDGRVEEHLALLRQHRIGTDDDAIIKFLRTRLPNSEKQAEIAKLVRQLDSDKFSVREAASAKLPTFGAAARAKLTELTKSTNDETAWRAKRILEQIESGENLRQQEMLTYAAVHVVGQRKSAGVAPIMLAIIANTEQPNLRDAATETLWKCASKAHGDQLLLSLGSKNPTVRAAAVVALEVVRGEAAVKSIQAFLASDDESLRLAAARALVNHQPRKVAEVLVDLVGSKDEEISSLAEALLREQTGTSAEANEKLSLAAAWRAWADKNLKTAKLNKLGEERLKLSHGRGLLVEMFTRNAADASKGYGRLVYEATVPSKTSVADGVLRMEYAGSEGDQRLAITSQKLTGRREWPSRFEIRAKMGGEETGSGTWHVGISIGNVKILYHPAYSGGGFRAEHVDSHDYFSSSNADMGFTPAAGALQDVTILVHRTARGATFDVSIAEGNKSFQKTIEVTPAQLGAFNRIGLERSGRSGGAALFDSFSVKLGQ